MELQLLRPKSFIPLLATLILAGCASEAQRKDAETDIWKKTLPAQNANYGSYPSNYEQMAKGYFSKTLKDPESARYGTFSKPRKEHVIKNVDIREVTYGYSFCASVNAKNSYGGYTGSHTYWFFIRDGQIIRAQDLDGTGPGRMIYIGRFVNCEDGDGK